MNAWTNLAFIAAGLWLWRKGKADFELRVFGALVVLIGIGSGLFHTFATQWAMAADVIPIGIALFYVLWVYQRRVFAWSRAQAGLGLGGFGVVSGLLAVSVPKTLFNETHTYFPCLVVLILFARHANSIAARRTLTVASVLFALSLTCRSVDLALCEAWPAGTHFLWHALNAAVLLLVGESLINQKAGHSRS